ncbi:hypothetical protein PV10_04811 [Exophiala mesophila]|uniref:Uncharacterized protein n=1 Tax=Exophiala mesophila TaxID=212818 RepID=A0A0D1WW72_EXOME|nr:uncharacterized protein PV10_04811 [Exophiala mesophila]KIV93610.1 hypothetical protein PV10_04811 [Exophiala mesophila]
MDAAEQDLDAKLYKASGTLLNEIKFKLPLLLSHPGTKPPKPRLQVLNVKCEELRQLLDRFQEWPQLLDPYLATMVQHLADAFIYYMANSRSSYNAGISNTSPLPRAICRLLYSFCKVRGYKVIVRLLNNEPRYLVPMLQTFQAWNHSGLGMTWEERYIMLLWLSHLMLAPFELVNMYIDTPDVESRQSSLGMGQLPGIAADVAPLALEQLQTSGKEQQTASILLVRLCLRKDMQQHDLHGRILNHAIRTLLEDHTLVDKSPYRALGLLSLLHGISNSASDSEIAPYLEKIFQLASAIATSKNDRHVLLRSFAPARKLLLKITRVVLTHAISWCQSTARLSTDSLNLMLEGGIQYFLDGLGDKETPVRMTAAKALSIIALKLDQDMSEEVIEAVLATLKENVFLEDPHTRKLTPLTERNNSKARGLRTNIDAVDPLKWHGLMLTLGHFLFRRSPPATMLTSIIQALISGLEFEQRSNVGTSVGVGVRDAACFGLWSVARKYSTAELALVDISQLAGHALHRSLHIQSVLQLLACRLSVSACSDPSGNIRRGASAALQELIGRHPDTISQGISIVQTIDYHAVARLSRAMLEVSVEAAFLDPLYHLTLCQAFTEWRGSRAVDPNQRRWASNALRKLAQNLPLEDVLLLTRTIYIDLLDLKSLNVGSTAGVRHGLLLALSSGLQALAQHDPTFAMPVRWLPEGEKIIDLYKLTGKIDGRLTADVELIMEGISSVISTMSSSIAIAPDSVSDMEQSWVASAWEILSHCTGSSSRELVVEASAHANFEVITHLPVEEQAAILSKWLDPADQSPTVYTSKGRMKTLSLLHNHLVSAKPSQLVLLRKEVVSYLVGIIEGSYKIETRVDAMEGLSIILPSIVLNSVAEARSIADALSSGLADYTNDQRGDIGSTLRLKSLDAVDSLRDNVNLSADVSRAVLEAVMPPIVKLAAEKLNNVRFRAWQSLERHLSEEHPTQSSPRFDYLGQVSSVAYFENLLHLLSTEWARKSLIQGLVSSATAGTEDICRAASNAFVAYFQSLPVYDRDVLVRSVSKIVLDHFADSATQDDKAVLPMLDFLGVMIDHDLFHVDLVKAGDVDLFSALLALQGSSCSLARAESLLNAYSRIVGIATYRVPALDKMTRQLLHRWPRVRNTAADLLYLHAENEKLAEWDWNRQPAENKPVVLDIRKDLGIAGGAKQPPSR